MPRGEGKDGDVVEGSQIWQRPRNGVNHLLLGDGSEDGWDVFMEVVVCAVSTDGGAFVEGAVAPGKDIDNIIVLRLIHWCAGWRNVCGLGKMEDLVGNLESPVVAFSKVVGHELLEGWGGKHERNGRRVEF